VLDAFGRTAEERADREEDWSFDAARSVDGGNGESYSEHILNRVASVGVVQAACEDIADALGHDSADTDGFILLRGAARHWRGVADRRAPAARDALALQVAAIELENEVSSGEFVGDYIVDVIQYLVVSDLFVNLVVQLEGNPKAWWRDRSQEAYQLLSLLSSIRQGLEARNESLDGLPSW